MKSAVTYLYKTSKETLKERDEKKEWRKTYDPNYVPRRSILFGKIDNRRSRVMSMFGRPPRASTYGYSTRGGVSTVSTVSDRGSMSKGSNRDTMDRRDRYTLLKIPEEAHLERP